MTSGPRTDIQHLILPIRCTFYSSICLRLKYTLEPRSLYVSLHKSNFLGGLASRATIPVFPCRTQFTCNVPHITTQLDQLPSILHYMLCQTSRLPYIICWTYITCNIPQQALVILYSALAQTKETTI